MPFSLAFQDQAIVTDFKQITFNRFPTLVKEPNIQSKLKQEGKEIVMGLGSKMVDIVCGNPDSICIVV